MKIINILKKRTNFLCAFLINTLFPIECIDCQKEDEWICSECLSKIKFNKINFCPSCSKENNYGTFCGKCEEEYFLDGAWIAGEYKNKNLSYLIKKYKYNYAQEISIILGDFLFRFLIAIFRQAALSSFLSGKEFIPNIVKENNKLPQIMITPSYYTIIIPVPLHIKKLKYRGFNQSKLLAEIVAKKSDIVSNSTNLIKIKNNKPQMGLKANERKINVKDSYRWRGKRLDGKNIILVDDVITTGATLNECARILKEAGANEVWGLVLAKN